MTRDRVPAVLSWLIAATLLFAGAAQAATGKRVALVIGNGAYENAVALANPRGDARSVADKLRQLGFVVVEGYDLDHDGFEDTIKDFSRTVQGADIGMFFYAGHGMQVNGRNYLIPVDAAFRDAAALDFEAIEMDLVTKQMQRDVAVRVVILDACRDNPLSKTLSRSLSGGTRSNAVAEGLAEVKLGDAGEGTAIIFATSPDEVALDGEGEHSPFTTALLSHIDAPDTDLQVVMSRVTGDVYASTKQQQRPWINASLTGEVVLNPQRAAVAPAQTAATAPSAPATAQDALQRETMLYNLARDSGLAADYEAYLETFPDGLYAANARKQLERLKSEGGTAVASAPAAVAVPPLARAIAPGGLDLPVTEAMKAMPSGPDTEDWLELDRAKRAEIQTRLKLGGFDPGSSDGSFGRRTRNAIQAWQSARGLTPSGYFNQPQLELLTVQTETAYVAYLPDPYRPADPPRSSQRRTGNNPERTTGRSSRAGRDAEQAGRFIGGVVRGALRF